MPLTLSPSHLISSENKNGTVAPPNTPRERSGFEAPPNTPRERSGFEAPPNTPTKVSAPKRPRFKMVGKYQLDNVETTRVENKQITDENGTFLYTGPVDGEGRPHGIGRVNLLIRKDGSLATEKEKLFDQHFIFNRGKLETAVLIPPGFRA